MLKYGRNSFSFVELEKGVPNEKLDELERFHIACLSSTNPSIGYNSESGGHAGRNMSDQTKKKLSDNWDCKVKWFHKSHGEVAFTISSLAREFSLDYSSLHDVRNGRARSHRGWICLSAPHDPNRFSAAFIWEHPEFGTHIGDTTHICRIDPRITRGSPLAAVRRGELPHYRKWRFVRQTTAEEDLGFRLWWATQAFSDAAICHGKKSEGSIISDT
jgi:hypothetical protein